MRTLLLFLFMLSLSTAVPVKAFQVLVYTRDHVIVDYVCQERIQYEPGAAVRSVVKSPGHINWHGVGGVQPYREISREWDPSGMVCVTVMDASGEIATGCSGLYVNRQTVFVPCPEIYPRQKPQECDTIVERLTCRNDAITPTPLKPVPKPPKPKPEPRKPVVRHVSDKPVKSGRGGHTDRPIAREPRTTYDRGTGNSGGGSHRPPPVVRQTRGTSTGGTTPYRGTVRSIAR